MKKVALVVATLATFFVTTEVNLYGTTPQTLNGGIMLRERFLPICAGFEVRGSIGFFGGRYEECDI